MVPSRLSNPAHAHAHAHPLKRLPACPAPPLRQNKLFGNLGLGQACSVSLEFALSPSGAPAPTVTVKGKRGEAETLPLFSNKDTIAGEVKVAPVPGRRVEHQGIRVQLVGEIEMASERGHPHEFVSLGELSCGARSARRAARLPLCRHAFPAARAPRARTLRLTSSSLRTMFTLLSLRACFLRSPRPGAPRRAVPPAGPPL
jgi:vacuolar protein sorting-associated protein 26